MSEPILESTHVPNVTVRVPSALRDCCAGAADIASKGHTLRALLDDLAPRFPALYRSVCDETGTVRRHVNLFVNAANVRDGDGVRTRLAPGDVISILPAVSGG